MTPHADFTIHRRDVQRVVYSQGFESFAFPDGAQQVQFLDLCKGDPTDLHRLAHCIWALRFDEQPDAHRRRVTFGMCCIGWVASSKDECARHVYNVLQDWLLGNQLDDTLRDLLELPAADTREWSVAKAMLQCALSSSAGEQSDLLKRCSNVAIGTRTSKECEYQMTALRNLWSDPTRTPERDVPAPDDDEGDDEEPAQEPEPAPTTSPAPDPVAAKDAEIAMYRMFFALIDVRRRIHIARAEESAMLQGLKSTAEKARALGATIPQAIAEAK